MASVWGTLDIHRRSRHIHIPLLSKRQSPTTWSCLAVLVLHDLYTELASQNTSNLQTTSSCVYLGDIFPGGLGGH